MACIVKKSQISDIQINKIYKMLALSPIVNKKYTKHKPKPILFYIEQDELFYLPYLFTSSLLQFNPNDNIIYPTVNFEFTGKLYDKQIEVEEESWNQLQMYGTTTLGLYPGYGKTVLGVKLASRLKLITIVLVHREVLMIQWKNSFERFSNAKVWIVNGKDIPSEYNVIICLDTRWKLLPSEIRNSIGFLIIDEAHTFCTPKHIKCLLSFQPKFILIETATLERDDGMHSIIYAIAGSHGVFRDSNKPFNVIKVSTNIRPIRKYNSKGYVSWSELIKSLLFNEERNELIIKLINSNLENKILVLTNLVEHVKLLHDKISKLGISCDYMCSNKKNYYDCKILIGTYSKIGTGFDQETLCSNYLGERFNLLIIASSIKKYSMLIQNIGRVFRSDNPIIIFLVDNDKILKSHWYKVKNWFVNHGAKIIKFQ